MSYKDTQKSITCSVWCYIDGRYTIRESLQMITRDIENYTQWIYDIDKKISTQNRLYKQGLKQLLKAIDKMEKHG